jgi:hypothetical protein
LSSETSWIKKIVSIHPSRAGCVDRIQQLKLEKADWKRGIKKGESPPLLMRASTKLPRFLDDGSLAFNEAMNE